MTPSSSLHLNRLLPISQIRTTLERIGATGIKFHHGFLGGNESTFSCSFYFDYKGEGRNLMYFFGPGSSDGFGACLSINNWGHDQEILSGLKGAFGGQWICDDEPKKLEATPGLEDIAGPSDEDGMLMFIFIALAKNLSDRPDLITHQLERVPSRNPRFLENTMNLVPVKKEVFTPAT